MFISKIYHIYIKGERKLKRALVTLPEGVWRVIDELKGTLGDGDSEVIRNIVIAHLTERGILIPNYNIRATAKDDHIREKASPTTFVDALSRVLVRKGVITHDELAMIRKTQRVSGVA